MSTPKLALVTGANKGIGLETARQLGQLGITVLVGARDAAKAESAASTLKAAGLEAHPLVIDVSDPASIAAAAAKVTADFGRLDILINNAGIMVDKEGKRSSEQSLATWRETFETNVFGLIATTQAFLPLLRKSEAGRIVNLSSILGSNTLHQDPASPIYGSNKVSYNVSKSAVNAWTVQLAHELAGTMIKVNSAHPGWVKTDMGGAGAQLELADGAKTSVELATLPADGPTGSYQHLGKTLPW